MTSSLYNAIWRWHFYAGLIFAPFLIILAVSGGVYLFKPQIENILYKDMISVREVGQAPLTLAHIKHKVESEMPNTTVASFTLPQHQQESYKLSVMHQGKMMTMYVDPYTGEVLGMIDSEKTFAAFFKKMHSELVVGGTIANRLVELAACWGLILIGTGLYLWWPRNKNSIWGIVLPRWSKPGSRIFWRDLHAVPAFWVSLILVLIILGGLPWSGVLGPQIDKIANATNTNTPHYAFSFMGSPTSVTVAQDIAEDLPWAAQNINVPASAVGNFVPLSVNDVAKLAETQQLAKPYTITLPQGRTGVFTLSTAQVAPSDNATLHLDQYSGAILSDVRFADYGILGKIITIGIAFHEGRLFGLANQLLGLLACLGLIGASLTSYVMWKKRKPTGKLGAPASVQDKGIRYGVLLIMIVAGVIMPLVGISLIVVILLEWLVLRRIPACKQWFSI